MLAATLTNLVLLFFAAPQEEVEGFERAIRAYSQQYGERSAEVALVYSRQGRDLLEKGKWKLAEPRLTKALELLTEVRGEEHLSTLSAANMLAAVKLRMGRYSDAADLQSRVLTIARKSDEVAPVALAIYTGNLATSSYRLGRWEDARTLYREASDLHAQHSGPNHWQTLENLAGLAGTLGRQGNFEEGIPLMRDVLERAKAELGEMHPLVWNTINNLAELLQSNLQLEEAKAHFERGAEVAEEIYGPNHLYTYTSLYNLAFVLKKLGNAEEAMPYAIKAYQGYVKLLGEGHPDTTRGLGLLADLKTGLGDLDEARRLRLELLDVKIAAFGEQHFEAAIANSALAVIEQESGNYAKAIEYCLKTISIDSRIILREFPRMSETERFLMLRKAVRPTSLLNCQLSLSAKVSIPVWNAYVNWKGLVNRMQRIAVRVANSSSSEDVRLAVQEIDVLDRKISNLILQPQPKGQKSPLHELRLQRNEAERKFQKLVGMEDLIQPLDGQAILDAIPPKSVYLDFYVDGQVYFWVARNGEPPRLRVLGTAADLRQAQEKFLQASISRGGRVIAKEERPHEDLIELLWKPISKYIAPDDQIFISPDGFLCELPFGVLPVEDDVFLIEKHKIQYLNDTTLFLDQGPTSQDRLGPMLAVGDVNYFRRDAAPQTWDAKHGSRSRIGQRWSSLAATREEVQSIQDLWEYILEWEAPLTVLTGKAASEEAVREQISGKRYLHFATHGYFEPDHLPSLRDVGVSDSSQATAAMLPALLSGLVFAGVNSEAVPDREDGYLSAQEVGMMDLEACDLAVLSACETALGSKRAGNGLMSLRRSFELAGAETVISSLWKVDDRATAQLMKDFYQNYLELGMEKSAALQEAKLKMLRQNRQDNQGDAAPSTWGAFVLSGNWQ